MSDQAFDSEEFRYAGREVVDWITDFLDGARKVPVVSSIRPGGLLRELPREPPEDGVPFEEILRDFRSQVVPAVTHWNHPSFHAFFCSSASPAGILGELLSTCLNTNCMTWLSNPAGTELEQVTVSWVRQLLGLPREQFGVIHEGASINTFYALAAARESLDLDIRERGMAGRSDIPQMRVYTSEHAHSSLDKAVIALGLGYRSIRRIAIDDSYAMDARELDRAIMEDLRKGIRPLAVAASIGTTGTGAVDPIADIADICAGTGTWLHVDAAYGGSAAMLPEMRGLFSGWERADSLVVNPHKWMFVPLDLGLLFTRHPARLRSAFSHVPAYLENITSAQTVDYMDYGLALGRRFRALKLWFVLRYFGAEGIRAIIRRHLELARGFAEWVEGHPRLELAAPPNFGLVCFRVGDADPERSDQLTRELMLSVNRSRKVFLSHTELDGRFVLRMVVGHLRTEREHVELVEQLVDEALEHDG